MHRTPRQRERAAAGAGESDGARSSEVRGARAPRVRPRNDPRRPTDRPIQRSTINDQRSTRLRAETRDGHDRRTDGQTGREVSTEPAGHRVGPAPPGLSGGEKAEGSTDGRPTPERHLSHTRDLGARHGARRDRATPGGSARRRTTPRRPAGRRRGTRSPGARHGTRHGPRREADPGGARRRGRDRPAPTFHENRLRREGFPPGQGEPWPSGEGGHPGWGEIGSHRAGPFPETAQPRPRRPKPRARCSARPLPVRSLALSPGRRRPTAAPPHTRPTAATEHAEEACGGGAGGGARPPGLHLGGRRASRPCEGNPQPRDPEGRDTRTPRGAIDRQATLRQA